MWVYRRRNAAAPHEGKLLKRCEPAGQSALQAATAANSLRIVLSTTLIAGLAFIALQPVALVARLTFVALLTGCRRGDPFFQRFDLETYLLHFVGRFHGEPR